MSDLLVATHNAGKTREIRGLLERAGAPAMRVLSLLDLGITGDVEETGATFVENAIAKAVGYSRSPKIIASSDLLVLADDSGLEVEALDGAPGVKSARYGGPGLTDEDRNSLLLREMKGVPWNDRTARFVCVLALARGGELVELFEGQAEGLIAFEPRGPHGFGYDPVFYYPPLSRAFGELSPAEKGEVSHRGQALRKLQKFIEAARQS